MHYITAPNLFQQTSWKICPNTCACAPPFGRVKIIISIFLVPDGLRASEISLNFFIMGIQEKSRSLIFLIIPSAKIEHVSICLFSLIYSWDEHIIDFIIGQFMKYLSVSLCQIVNINSKRNQHLFLNVK